MSRVSFGICSVLMTALAFFSACQPEKDTTTCGDVDADLDGYDACEDCDDSDFTVNPAATEVCDGIDSDCDGLIDGDDPGVFGTLWFPDADGDGYGSIDSNGDGDFSADEYAAYEEGVEPGSSWRSCDPPADTGWVSNSGDCDETDPDVNSGATEICDGIDNDCDREVDEDLPTSTYYHDQDGDGYGDPDSSSDACGRFDGWVENDSDCDDTDSLIYPGAEEICDGVDDDCDGVLMDAEQDFDVDGFLAYEDCDDTDAAIYPGATDVWYDGVDSDCAGDDDYDQDGDGHASVQYGGDDCIDGADLDDDNPAGLEPADLYPGATETWYDGTDQDCAGDDDYDQDGDGYDLEGSDRGSNDDCDDTLASVNPGEAENLATSWDDNCDGSTEDDASVDDDDDGYDSDVDCDDSDASVNPGATETCDGIDDDCDGEVDEDDASDAPAWYADADDDGYGDPSVSTAACDMPSGYVAEIHATDCDDTDASVNPSADEYCNDVDDDCNGTVDDYAVDKTTWHKDSDGDGYGSDVLTRSACDMPSGYVADGGDCNDRSDLYYPGATEACGDTEDYNCDGSVADEDADADGYVACEDCSDSDASVNPGATETCDGIDDDCDGEVDEDDASDASAWYADADDDGYGDPSVSTAACDMPSGYVADDTDCDDGDASASPAESEVCDDLVDNDCDGSVDEDCGTTGATDADGDGYDSSVDCDDSDDTVYPGSPEVVIVSGAVDDLCSDGKDQDCDGLMDDADWDCQDDDADGTLNGVDALVPWDLSGDGRDDTLCVVALEGLVADDPWYALDTYIQGDATAWGGGFASLSKSSATLVELTPYADSDGDGTDDIGAWCVTGSDYGLSSGAWNGRVVSDTAQDGATDVAASCDVSTLSGTWYVPSLATFCGAVTDVYCRTGVTTRDGCGTRLGTIFRFRYASSTSSIAPY